MYTEWKTGHPCRHALVYMYAGNQKIVQSNPWITSPQCRSEVYAIKFQKVKKTFPKTFTIQPLNVVPTAERNSGNGKRHSTVRPLTIPFSARVCHAHFSLASPVRYLEVAKLVLTLHKPWQRPTAPKALKNPIDFDAIVPSWRWSYAIIAGCGAQS